MISIKLLKGFSLAEMMVVLIIMSVITAAFLPVMTKKAKNFDQLWQLAANNSDIYSQMGGTQSAIIGDSKNNNNTKLLINSLSAMPDQIGFAENGTFTGRLKLDSGGNLYLGAYSDLIATGGSNNIAMGFDSLASNSSGVGNFSAGSEAMLNNSTGSNNVAIGHYSLYGALNGSGGNNVAIGYQSMYNNYSGVQNTAIGYQSLFSNYSGSNNIAMGQLSLSNNYDGYDNTAIGDAAMRYNTAGFRNVAIGLNALGGQASTTNNGTYNSALGVGAIPNNTTGAKNTGVGAYVLSQNTTGSNNTAVGYQACQNVTGSNKTCIGVGSGPDAAESQSSDTSDVVYIGTPNSTVYIPGNLVVGKNTIMGARSVNDNVNYQVYLKGGNKGASSSWVFLGTDDYVGGDDNFYRVGSVTAGAFTISGDSGTIYSDRRLKNVKGLNNDSLDKIRKLKVYNYTFKKDKKKFPQVGVIAQDLQKVFPNAVAKDKHGYLMIRKDDMFYAMINSIKQLDKTVQEISKKVYYVIADLKNIHKQIFSLNNKDNENIKKTDDLYKKYNNMNAELTKVKKENHALTAQIKKLEASKH